MKTQVTQSFRYASGAPARMQPITVVDRGLLTKPVLYTDAAGLSPTTNPLPTDGSGNLSFYVTSGHYDFLVFSTRVPFDALEAGGISRYTHTQSSPAAQWTINHGLGTKPDVVLVADSSPGEKVYSDVFYVDDNTLTVEWPSPESGAAYLS